MNLMFQERIQMSQNSPLENESSILISIEDFMVSTCHEQFVDDHEEFKRELLEAIVWFKQIYREDFTYSRIIRVFKRVIVLVDYIMEKLDFHMYTDILKFELNHIFYIQGMIQYEMKNALREKLDFQYQEQSNRFKLEYYLKQLLTHYARLLFVRVDIGILKAKQVYWDIEDFYEALRILRNRMSNKDTCFSGLQGFAWALEQGAKKGYHCHLLLIYDGNRHHEDSGLAKQVAEYWEQITNQQGTYYNCNTKENKEKFDKNGLLGIGMIHRDQPIQFTNAIRAAMYLVNPEKEDQHLRVKTSPQMRTFGTGQYEVEWRRGL